MEKEELLIPVTAIIEEKDLVSIPKELDIKKDIALSLGVEDKKDIEQIVADKIAEEKLKEKKDKIFESINGKVVRQNILDPETGEVLVKKRTMLDEDTSRMLADREIENIKVRDKLVGKGKTFVKKIFKWLISAGVATGAAVGIVGLVISNPLLASVGVGCSVCDFIAKVGANAGDLKKAFKGLSTNPLTINAAR